MKKITNQILTTPYKWLIAAVFLFLLSFLFSQFSKKSNLKKEWKKLELYITKNTEVFEKFSLDTALLKRLVNQQETKEEFEKMADNRFGFFLFRKYSFGGTELHFWNNQESLPSGDLYNLRDGEYFKKLENGYYLCIKKSVLLSGDTDSTIAIGLIPVLYDYFVETGYLPNKFAHSKNANDNISLSQNQTPFAIRNKSGKPLFFVSEKERTSNAGTYGLDFWSRILSSFFLLIFLHFISEKQTKRFGILRGVVTLVLLLILIRFISYYTSFPLNLSKYELFDPSIYAANQVQKSLGDLLINAIFFCWISLFAWNKIKRVQIDWQRSFYQQYKLLLGALGLILIMAITFIFAKTIRSLAADSNICSSSEI